ncbi:HPP family protein [Paenibacillus turpanensis]|uniref:HPP family protein n=1 Tax=Paenibacillus turpanensis TaxID=2689078 RepID=UPI00140879E6|nr:HPP family protein [Paenibacillus turpanensis]
MNWKTALFSALGGFISIFALSFVGQWSEMLLLMAPFGASCVILYVLPESTLAQPRSVIGGHVVSTLAGLTVLGLFGSHPWSLALGVGLAILLMQLTKTTHPPAGADPLVVIASGVTWSFVFTPVLIGSVTLVLLAAAYHRFSRQGKSYPLRWL